MTDSPNTTREDFTNSTINTSDLSLLEEEVANIEELNADNSFNSSLGSINQDENQHPFDVDVEPIPPNRDDT